MAAEVDLVNAALRKVGAKAIAAISDTTPGGAIAGDVFAFERDDLLRSCVWNFAATRASLSTTTPPTFGVNNAFALPSDWLRTISVHNASSTTSYVQYKMETVSVAGTFTRCIVTDTSAISIRYVRQVTDVNLMDSSFQRALILRLAMIFAIGLAASPALYKGLSEELAVVLADARRSDEIEDYPEALPQGHWASSIVNAALRKAGIVRVSDDGSPVPVGIVSTEIVQDETDALLRAYTWNFATTRADLTPGASPVFGFTNSFTLPSDFLRIVSVHDHTDPTTYPPYRFENINGTRSILTDATDIYIRYVHTISVATRLAPGFRQALTLKLARVFASSNPNSAALIPALDKEFAETIQAAMTAEEIEDYPEALPAGHWASSIVNVALRKAGIVRASDGSSPLPAGVLSTELVQVEANALLNAYTWNFATTRADLTATTAAPTFGFTNAFALPSDCLRVITVHDTDDPTVYPPYKIESVSVTGTFTKVILTDADDIYIRYVRTISLATLLSQGFKQALSLKLAKIFAASYPNGAALLPVLEKEFQETIQSAIAVDEIEDYPEAIPAAHWAYGIVNNALRKVGIVRGADQGSPIPAGLLTTEVAETERDALLRAHTWNFAVHRTRLGNLILSSPFDDGFDDGFAVATITTAPFYEYTYAYMLPSDFLRTIAVHDNSAGTGAVEYRMESCSPNLVTNGDFESDIDWTKGTGWTISGGVASKAVGVSSDLEQGVLVTEGGTYRITFTVSGMSAGTLSSHLDGTGDSAGGPEALEDGFIVGEVTAVALNDTFALTASADFDGDVSEVTVARIDPGAEVMNVIMTDASEIWLTYVRRISNASTMPADFRNILTLRLAKVFAASLPNAAVLNQQLDYEMRNAIREARSIDGIENMIDQVPAGSWLTSRGGNPDLWRRGSIWPTSNP